MVLSPKKLSLPTSLRASARDSDTDPRRGRELLLQGPKSRNLETSSSQTELPMSMNKKIKMLKMPLDCWILQRTRLLVTRLFPLAWKPQKLLDLRSLRETQALKDWAGLSVVQYRLKTKTFKFNLASWMFKILKFQMACRELRWD